VTGLQKPVSRAAEKKARLSKKEKQWRLTRAVVQVRDRFKCRHCRTKDGVDVHHIKLRSAGGKDDSANCCLLCRICHAEIHAYRLSVKGNANEHLKFEVTK
jgi:5-methylcytosine-specific restriction endonuclease McrA